MEIDVKIVWGLGHRRLGGKGKHRVYYRKSFLFILLQPLQTAKCGGSKYVQDFSETLSFEMEPNSLPFEGELDLVPQF